MLGPCAYHFTTLDLTHRGMVVIGQAAENLPQILLGIEGDDIVAVGTLGILYASATTCRTRRSWKGSSRGWYSRRNAEDPRPAPADRR